MLTAELEGNRIDALTAERGPSYFCPKCKDEVVLKKGRKVVHHFAHKPPTDCTWAKGETRAHMESKVLVADAFKKRGLRAELGFVVKTLPGDRRADVMAWSPKGLQIAAGSREIAKNAPPDACAGGLEFSRTQCPASRVLAIGWKPVPAETGDVFAG